MVEEIINFYASVQKTDSSSLSQNFTFMRILRVLRLIGELRTIVTSIVSSLKHLLWTVLLLLLLIYTLAVYLTQLVVDTRLSDPDADFPNLLQWWNSVGRSCMTLFQAISGGVDWDATLEPLSRHISVLLAP